MYICKYFQNLDLECFEEYYEIPESPQAEIKDQEEFEPEIYEEFNKQEDKTSLCYSKYLEVLDDHNIQNKSQKKVMFADDDDNEYEPIDRTVGAV